MMKIMRLHDMAIHTVAAGVIDDLVFAFKGTIGEQPRKRIACTTRRGFKGKAQRGGVTGGRTLGYGREIVGQGVDGRAANRLVVKPDEADPRPPNFLDLRQRARTQGGVRRPERRRRSLP